MIKEGDWQQELPQEPGDWLWVTMWGCGCCVHSCGIAYVFDAEEADTPERFLYTKDGKQLAISWESPKEKHPYIHEGKPDITAWMKVELPPYEWSNWK